ncbi:MAG: hypothetical protein ACYS3N_23910 [Planctomycetota bacterium]
MTMAWVAAAQSGGSRAMIGLPVSIRLKLENTSHGIASLSLDGLLETGLGSPTAADVQSTASDTAMHARVSLIGSFPSLTGISHLNF